ncbi:MAG: hypothetical protein MJZ01_06710 [Bacteroidales bacterium]|nr:hypothetical protein [Bacteroidales bacterium]
MKNFLTAISLLLCAFVGTEVKADELVVKGTYQGENIYVRNPFAPSGVGFCAYEVTVNGMITTDEINSSAFEIDLSVYGFSIGDEVSVAIKYKDDCTPMVLNTYALQVKTPAKFESIAVKDGVLTFSTSGETGSIPFVIEQYRWNKWVKVGEVRGKGKNKPNTYEAKVRTHSGANKFRVRQTDNKKISVYSKEAVALVTAPVVTFKQTDSAIDFSAETMYEIYDQYGGIVFKGYGATINIGSLAKGKYYLNFDNSQSEFTKK